MANCPQATLHCRKTTLGVVHRAARAKMAAELHPRSGKLIGLSNSNRTAQRNQPVQEFNHGLVLSREPLRDRDVFTVCIDKKVNKHVPPERESEREREIEKRVGVCQIVCSGSLSALIHRSCVVFWCVDVFCSHLSRFVSAVDVWMLVCLDCHSMRFHHYQINLI